MWCLCSQKITKKKNPVINKPTKNLWCTHIKELEPVHNMLDAFKCKSIVWDEDTTLILKEDASL